MILALDMGNTNILIGGYENDRLLFTARMHTAVWRTADEWALLLGDILRRNGLESRAIEGSIVSSLVPPVTGALADGVGAVCQKPPLIVGAEGVKAGLKVCIDHPALLGADMICNAVAALTRTVPPIIIIDMGTATSIGVIDSQGQFIGGAIVPGVRTSASALSNNAAQLPHIHLQAPSRVIASNTVECMQSGLLFGTAALIEGMCSRVEEELGQPCTVLATGGLSETVAPLIRRPVIHAPDLLLEGLYQIYLRNR